MYKEDLALNNLRGLICHETQPNVSVVLLCSLLTNTVGTGTEPLYFPVKA